MSTTGGTPQASACRACARPDLAAIGGDGGVVGHVLGLERTHPQAAPGKVTAQPRDQHAFPDIGAGALDHDGARHAAPFLPDCNGPP